MKKAGLTSLNMVPKNDVNFSIVCSIIDDGLRLMVKDHVNSAILPSTRGQTIKSLTSIHSLQ